METKFIVKIRFGTYAGKYWRANLEGNTYYRSEAHHYTLQELHEINFFQRLKNMLKRKHVVLIPVTPSKPTLYCLQRIWGKGTGRYFVRGGLSTTNIALASLYTKEEIPEFSPYHYKVIPVTK